jgi:choline kinase
MHITKAVITAAGRNQQTLPLQTLIDRDGQEKSVLAILLEEVHNAGIEEVCLVVRPGDEEPYASIVGHRRPACISCNSRSRLDMATQFTAPTSLWDAIPFSIWSAITSM